jgi:hypothetical protein
VAAAAQEPGEAAVEAAAEEEVEEAEVAEVAEAAGVEEAEEAEGAAARLEAEGAAASREVEAWAFQEPSAGPETASRSGQRLRPPPRRWKTRRPRPR